MVPDGALVPPCPGGPRAKRQKPREEGQRERERERERVIEKDRENRRKSKVKKKQVETEKDGGEEGASRQWVSQQQAEGGDRPCVNNRSWLTTRRSGERTGNNLANGIKRHLQFLLFISTFCFYKDTGPNGCPTCVVVG